MKRQLLKSILLLLALVVGSNVWAEETPVYTLSFTKLTTGTNYNSYTAAHTTTSNNVQWSVFGNQSLGSYIRVGGKTTTNTNRTLTSSAVLSSTKAIGKVIINHSGTGNGSNSTITINSITVEGSTSSSFATSKSKTISNPSVSTAGDLEFTLDDGTWDEKSYFKITVNYVVTKTNASGNANNCYITINTVKFYEPEVVEEGTTAAPTILGTQDFFTTRTVSIQNDASAEGAAIYYTLNGDTPTTTTSETCFAYTAPFEISATTTVKAIAKHEDDDNASAPVSKTFTKQTVLEGIEALNSAANGTHYVNLTGAQFTYVNGSQGYLDDADAGIIYYNNSAKPVLKTTYNGIYQVAKTVYYGMPELTAITAVSGESTTTVADEVQAPVELTVSEVDDNITDHLARRVQITEYTITDADALTANIDFFTTWFNPNLTVGKKYTLIGYPYNNNGTYQFRITSASVCEAVAYADGWMSYVTPSAITFPENVEAYVVTALSPSLTREKITSAPEGTPVVLHATEGAKTYALPVAASADDPASNELKESDGTIVGNGKIYVLTVKGGQAGFAPLKTTSTLSAGKVYIEFLTAPAKDFIGFDDGETTSIESIHNSQFTIHTDAPMFNLSGQRVSESYKGIVIVNGKKVIRK